MTGPTSLTEWRLALGIGPATPRLLREALGAAALMVGELATDPDVRRAWAHVGADLALEQAQQHLDALSAFAAPQLAATPATALTPPDGGTLAELLLVIADLLAERATADPHGQGPTIALAAAHIAAAADQLP